MFPVKAYAIYGDLTKDFNHQWIMKGEDDEPDDFPTAYGVNLRPTRLSTTAACYICDNGNCDMLTEHGATGSPAEGVPAHLRCQLDGGNRGFLLHTELVSFVTPEPLPLTSGEKVLLKMAVDGYTGICRHLAERVSRRDWDNQLKVWESLAAKLDLR